MSESYTLEAQPRTIVGKKVKNLRREGLIPAVVYGVGMTPLNLTCPRRALDIVLAKAGTTHLVSLSVDGTTYNTLVRAVQRDAIKRDVVHVDFLQVDLTKTLRTEVQIVLVNVPKLGSELMITYGVMSVEVECLPTNIPTVIEADASKLTNIDAKLTIADLPKLPNVEYIADVTDVVAAVAGVTEMSEEELMGEAVLTEPEVVEKGKKEEEVID